MTPLHPAHPGSTTNSSLKSVSADPSQVPRPRAVAIRSWSPGLEYEVDEAILGEAGCSTTSIKPPRRCILDCGTPATGWGSSTPLRMMRRRPALGDEHLATCRERKAPGVCKSLRDCDDAHLVLFGGVEDPGSVAKRDTRHADLTLGRESGVRNREQGHRGTRCTNKTGVRHRASRCKGAARGYTRRDAAQCQLRGGMGVTASILASSPALLDRRRVR